MQRILQLSLLITLLISPFFHALVWQNTLQVFIQNGVLSFDILLLLRSVPGVIFVLTISYVPIVVFMLTQTLNSIPMHVINSARLSMHDNKIFRFVILPYLTPTLLSVALLIGILVFNTFDVPAFYETNVFITEIFSMYSSRFDTGRALLLSLIPVLLTITGAWIIFSKVYKDKPLVYQRTSQSSDIIPTPSIIIQIGSVCTATLVLLGFVIPLVSVVSQSTLYSYSVLSELADSVVVIQNSIYLAPIGALIIVLFSFVGLLYKRMPILRIIGFSFLALPGVTFGILVIGVVNRPLLNFIYATPAMLILAYGFRFAPLIAELFYARSLQISPNEINSARLYVGSWVKRVIQTLLPYYKETIVIGLSISIWLVVTELPITLLLQPPGLQTITSRLYILLHYGSESLMNSLLVVLLVISILPVILVRTYTKYLKEVTISIQE